MDRPGYRLYVEVEPSRPSSSSSSKHGTPVLREEETVLYTHHDVGVAFRDRDTAVDTASLYVTSQRILLVGAQVQVDFDMQYVILHAVTRDPASYPVPCLYCQLDYDDDDDDDDDAGNDDDGNNNNENDDGDDNGNEKKEQQEDESPVPSDAVAASNNSAASATLPQLTPTGELFLIPSDDADLMAMFNAFSQAAELNPDDDDDDDDSDDDFIFDVNEVEMGAAQERALKHLESVFVAPSDQQQQQQVLLKDA